MHVLRFRGRKDRDRSIMTGDLDDSAGFGLCHRVVVFHDHGVSAVIERRNLGERTLIDAMFPHRGGSGH